MLKRFTILTLLAVSTSIIYSQNMRFSLATDLGLQRNFQNEQQYWAIGHAVNANFHLTPKEGIQVSFSYFSNGKFNNAVTATAKDVSTTPQRINYTNNARMRFRLLSIGYKKYILGNCETEKGWNLYGAAGFGLLMGRVINTHSVAIDTSIYHVPVRSGEANFKRLTIDLGLGWEKPLGGDFYFYTEARTFIPASDYPSKYIFVNKNAPFTGSLHAGLRIIF